MMRLILANSQLHNFGCYDYFPLTLTEAIAWLSKGEYFSTLRNRDMCFALHDLTGRNIYPLYGAPVPPLNPGDEALVYYVTLSETVRSLQQMTREYMKANYEFGMLKRVDGVDQEQVNDGTSDVLEGQDVE